MPDLASLTSIRLYQYIVGSYCGFYVGDRMIEANYVSALELWNMSVNLHNLSACNITTLLIKILNFLNSAIRSHGGSRESLAQHLHPLKLDAIRQYRNDMATYKEARQLAEKDYIEFENFPPLLPKIVLGELAWGLPERMVAFIDIG